MGYKFNEAQKNAIKKFKDLKASKSFQNFLEGISYLLDPQMNPVAQSLLEGAPDTPIEFVKLPPSGDNEFYNQITPKDLLLRTQKLLDEIKKTPVNEDTEFETEEELNQALNASKCPDLLLDVARVFNDKYKAFTNEFGTGTDLLQSVYDEKADMNTYRAFTLGEKVVSEMSKLSLQINNARERDNFGTAKIDEALYAENPNEEKIVLNRNKYEDTKKTYQRNQKKLRHELDTVINNGPKEYDFGKNAPNFKNFDLVDGILSKENLRENPDWFAQNSNIFTTLKENWLVGYQQDLTRINQAIQKRNDSTEKVIREINDKYDQQAQSIRNEYATYQSNYDDLLAQIGKDKQFSEYKEYKDIKQTVSDMMSFNTEDVIDEYIKNYDEDTWTYEFDRDNVSDFDSDIAEVSEQIAALEKESEADAEWIKSASDAFVQAKKVADLANHLDEVIGDKADIILAQTAEISKIVQNNSGKQILDINKIPAEAFSTGNLGDLRNKAKDRYADFVSSQKTFVEKVNATGLQKTIKSYSAILEQNKQFNDALNLNLDPGFNQNDLIDLELSFNDKNDPEKFGFTQKLLELSSMVQKYRNDVDEVMVAKTQENEALKQQLVKSTNDAKNQLQLNKDEISKLEKDRKDLLAKKKSDDAKAKADREKAVKETKARFDKEFQIKNKEYQDTRNAYRKDPDSVPMYSSYEDIAKQYESWNLIFDEERQRVTKLAEQAVIDANNKQQLENDNKIAEIDSQIKDLKARNEYLSKNADAPSKYNQQFKDIENKLAALNKLYQSVSNTMTGFDEVNKAVGGDAVDSRNKYGEYITSIGEIYQENDRVRQENIQLLQSIPEIQKYVRNDIQNAKKDKVFSNEDLERLEIDFKSRRDIAVKHAATLNYLKKYKEGLEKGQLWLNVKSKLNNIKDKEELEGYKKYFKERTDRLDENEKQRVAEIKVVEHDRKVYVDKQRQKREETYAEFKKGSDALEQLINDTKYAKRTLKSLKDDANKIIDAKTTINDTIDIEKNYVQAHYEAQHNYYEQNEDKLMDTILHSKKKYGWSSSTFRDLKKAINAYRDALTQTRGDVNQPLTTAELQAFKDRTANLKAELQKYIAKRYDPENPKKTIEGQVRLDAVMDLQNSLTLHQRDLDQYNIRMQDLNARISSIDIKPTSKIELEYMKMIDSPEKQPSQSEIDLAKNFYESDNLDKLQAETEKLDAELIEAEKNPSQETIQLNKEFDEEEKALNIQDEALEIKDVVNIALKNIDASVKQSEEITAKYFKDLHAKEVVIPKVHYMGQIYPEWENDKKLVPEDLWPVVEQFNEIMTNVPVDYGFDDYNKSHGFWDRVSRKEYILNKMAYKQFINANTLHKPVPKAEDLENIKNFDTRMSKIVNPMSLGYMDYLKQTLEENPNAEVMNGEEFVIDKFQLKDHAGYVKFMVEKRREAAEKLAADAEKAAAEEAKAQGIMDPVPKRDDLRDPRLFIANYGSFVNERGFVLDEINKKLKEAADASKLREKIIKEINSYDKELSRVKKTYGFDDYIKTIDVLPYDKYVKSLAGVQNFIRAKKLVVPKFDGPEENWTAEQKKQLADFNKLLKDNEGFGYNEAYASAKDLQKALYKGSGMAQIAYIKKHPKLIDPRVKYSSIIREDGILRSMYRPDLANEQTVSIHFMNQINEAELPDVYEKQALGVIDRVSGYSTKAGDKFKGNYYMGFDKYPKDLQEQIRKFDMIRDSIDKEYGYASFEKNVDFCHVYSLERYIEEGMAWKYFAQQHQIVDPRENITAELCKKINEYDSLLVPDARAHKAWEFYKKENNDNISFEDYKKTIYGEQNLKNDLQHEKDQLEINMNEFDPRLQVENYGRLVLNKEEYAKYKEAHPLFDDSVRLERNKKIVAEMKAFVEKIKDVKLDYGFKAYKQGDNIDEYITHKEYMQSDEAVRRYCIDKDIINPLNTYREYVNIDSDLRRQINEATQDYRDHLSEQRKEIAAQPESPEDQKLRQARDESKAAVEKQIADKMKAIDVDAKNTYQLVAQWISMRKKLTKLSEGIVNMGCPEETKDINQRINEINNKIAENVDRVKDNTSEDSKDFIISEIYLERYCDNLTINDIAREEKAIMEFVMVDNGQENIFGIKEIVPVSDSERHAFARREQRLEELMCARDQLNLMAEKNPKKAAEIKADPAKLKDFTENIAKAVRAQKKAESTAPVASNVRQRDDQAQIAPIQNQM